jgi:hypothetical protein
MVIIVAAQATVEVTIMTTTIDDTMEEALRVETCEDEATMVVS